MKKVLITGFDPFGGETINPALEATKLLNGKVIAGHEIVAKGLPVVRYESRDKLVEYIKEVDPVLVINVGQAGGRMEMSLERVAINVDDFRIPDNKGTQVVDELIAADGPTAYWSTLPIKAGVVKMREAGIPAHVSNSAGTYICNHIFYCLMHFLATEAPYIRGGFVHIPYLPEQVAKLTNQPSMSLETLAKGLEVLLETCLTTDKDIKFGDGKTE